MNKIFIVVFILSFKIGQTQILFPHTELWKKKFPDTASVIRIVDSTTATENSSEDNMTFATRLKSALLAKYTTEESRIEINGLGNIASSQNGESLSPSANIYTKLLPFKRNPFGRIYLGYNLGSNFDSTTVDSIKLGNLFLPDRNKYGYILRFEQNLVPYLKSIFNNDNSEEDDKYKFHTELSPFVEYNFNKINFKNVNEDSSKIQTSSWIYGLNIVRSIEKNDNIIAIQISPYYKRVIITDGTLGMYQKIFSGSLNGIEAPKKVNFLGLVLGLQINRFQFSFVMDNLKSKTIKNTSLNGGVYTIRATVIGDFIKL